MPSPSSPPFSIQLDSPRSAGVAALLARSTDYLLALYPPESCMLADAETLACAGTRFWVARRDGRPIACCALVAVAPEQAEIKRLYVDAGARGLGLGDRLLRTLEHEARRQALRRVLLETGTRQPEALALYRKHGYTERGPYAGYRPDPLSIFMEKRLEIPS